jgi:hypothetical protein
MKQSVPRRADSVSGVAISYQVDKVRTDALGGRPTLLAVEGWPEFP